MRAFVTVGATTHFDLLIEAVLSEDVRMALLQKGYNNLVLQVGPSPRFSELHEEREGLKIQVWKLKPSLHDEFQASDLIISHAGSGSILDALRLHKPLIVVPNPTLLHNHQMELAHALESHRYLRSSTVSDLASTVTNFNTDGLLPFPVFNGSRFQSLLDEEMGFDDTRASVP